MSHPPAVHLVGLDVDLDVAQDVPLVRRVEKSVAFSVYTERHVFSLPAYICKRPKGGAEKKGYLIFVTCDGRF